MHVHATFAARLSEALKQAGKTDARVAADAGISIQALNNYKESRLPKLEQAIALAAALGTTVGSLIGETLGKTQPEAGLLPSRHSENLPEIKTSAFALMGRSPEDLSQDVDATQKQVRDWIAGRSQPSHGQLIKLFNEVVKSVAAIKVAQDTATTNPYHRPRRKRAA